MRQSLGKERPQALHIGLQVLKHLVEPLLTFSIRGLSPHEGEDIAVGYLITVQVAKEALPQAFVGAIAHGAAQTCDVESLTWRDEGD